MNKITKYEIVLDSSGCTVSIDTIGLGSKNIIAFDDNSGKTKKIKSNENQIREAQSMAMKGEALLNIKPVMEETPVKSEEENTVNLEETAAVKESITIVPANDIIEDKKPEESLLDLNSIEPPKKRYSFESEEAPIKIEEPKINLYSAKPDSRIGYDNLYNADPLDKLKEDLTKADLTTLSGKTLKIGVSKLAKYDEVINIAKEEIDNINKQIKDLEEKRESKKNELKEVESNKASDVKTLQAAISQANQIDAYEKNLQEVALKQQQEEEIRKNKVVEEQLAAQQKLELMYSRIPSEFREEAPKKVISMEEIKTVTPNLEGGISSTTDVYKKLHTLEEKIEVPPYDFTYLRRSA